MINLTTADRFFAMFPSSSPSAAKADDKRPIEMRITAISQKVERYLNRFIESAERTESFTPDCGRGTSIIRLKAYPVESVESLTVYDQEYVEANDDFVIDKETGTIQLSYPAIQQFVCINPMNAIVVEYTGGMADDTQDFIDKYPDIESLVLDQVNFELTRVKNIANKSIAGAATTSQLNEYGLLPALCDTLELYKRRMVV